MKKAEVIRVSNPVENQHRGAPTVHSPEWLLHILDDLRKTVFSSPLYAWDYEPQEDDRYQKRRDELISSFRADPRFHHFANPAARHLPQSLAIFSTQDQRYWRFAANGGNTQLVELEGRLLSALQFMGIDSVWPTQEEANVSSRVSSDVADTEGVIHLTGPQIRAKENRDQAITMRDQGFLLKEIAHELGCSPRTIQNYLKYAK